MSMQRQNTVIFLPGEVGHSVGVGVVDISVIGVEVEHSSGEKNLEVIVLKLGIIVYSHAVCNTKVRSYSVNPQIVGITA